jgi:integrase
MEHMFGIVKDARSLLTSTPKSTVSEKTLADYLSKLKRLRAIAKDPGDFTEIVAIALQTSKASTWYARRAALMTLARTKLELALRAQDEVQREMKAAATSENQVRWMALIKSVHSWKKRLELVTSSGLPLDARHPRKTKRADMRGLPADWRERVVARMPSYSPATLVAAVTGCRPDELVTGVALTIREGILTARVKGSKVNIQTGKGQEWRSMAWPSNHESALVRDLADKVSAAGGALMVTIASAGNFSSAMRRASMREFPKRKNPLTPYCFRHQCAADMKASSMDSGDISAALGHSSDVTKSTYGRARMGRRTGGVVPATVKAAQPVRVKATSSATHEKTMSIKGGAAGHRSRKLPHKRPDS